MIAPATSGDRQAQPTADGAALPDRRVAFVYGSREVVWPGIGYKLFGATGAIRSTLIRCERLIQERLGWSLARVLLADRFPDQHFLEPSQAALQIALTEGWRERGVRPGVIAARCGGEFAAEYARGTLSLEDAIEVACRVARIYRDQRGAGRAMKIELAVADAINLRHNSPVEFSIAADTRDDKTVITGETGALAKMRGLLDSRQIGHSPVPLAVAFHSRVIEPWRDQILKPLNDRTIDAEGIPYYSAAAGGRDSGGPYAQRLWRTLRGSAVVTPMLQRLIEDGYSIFLEIGGQPSLGERIESLGTTAGKEVIVLPTMRLNERVEAVMDESQEKLRQLAVPTRSVASVR